MIINNNREPKYSLYFIGSIIIEKLLEKGNLSIKDLHTLISYEMNVNLDIDFIYFSLDWLYILKKIELEENMVILC